MVVFTCNNCGDSLQKPKVAKHYQFSCRHNPIDLTCVDCHKDFRGDEYVKHTKCITEDERYGGKGFTPKASANKGERKQQEWINVVQNLLTTSTNLTSAERNILNSLSKYENIPRKKAKFLNFIRSCLGNRVNMSVIESLWTKMEDSFKESMANNEPQTPNGSSSQNGKADQSENNIVENQNNENISRENGDSVEQDENADNQNTANGIESAKENKKKKKKSKKRALESDETREEEPVMKKRLENGSEEATEVSVSQEDTDGSKFLWKSTIIEIVTAKGEISLKKLKKKVVARYLNHCSNSVSSEKAISKFDKKFKKVTEISIVDEKVKLS